MSNFGSFAGVGNGVAVGSGPSQASLVVVPGVEWVRGKVECDADKHAAVVGLLPTLKAILTNVRDLDMVYHAQPDPIAFLKNLGLDESRVVVYIPLADYKLLVPNNVITEEQRVRAQQVAGIINSSYGVTDMGLIRGVKIEGDTLQVKFAVTTEGCPHKTPIENGIRSAVQEMFTLLGPAVGLNEADIVRVPDVWRAEDMSEALRAAAKERIDATHARLRTTSLTVNGSAPRQASTGSW